MSTNRPVTGTTTIRYASRIAGTELRRRWRRARSNRFRFWVVVLVVVPAALLAVAFAAVGGRAVGQTLASGGSRSAVPAARLVAGALWALVAFATLYASATTYGTVDRRDLLLTTVPSRDVAAGLVAAQLTLAVAGAALPTLALAAGVAFGAETVLVLATLPVAVALGLCSATAVGATLGFALRYLASLVALDDRYRRVLTWLPVVALFGLQVLGVGERAVDAVASAAAGSPVGYYGVLAVPVASGSTAWTVWPVAAILSLLAVPVAVSVIDATVQRTWYDSGPSGGSPSSASLGVDRLAAVLPRPTAAVVARTWRRARRAPGRLYYVAFPLLLVVEPAVAYLRTGALSPTAPLVAAVAGAWVTGGAFALDPVGDEGAALPATLLAPASGRQYVAGLAVAGLVPGLPLVAAVVAIVSIAARLPVATLAATLAFALALATAAPALAAAVGITVPGRRTDDRRAPLPSRTAVLLYSVALGALALPPLVAATGSADAVVVPLVAAGLVLAVGGVAFRSAASRFESYAL